MRSSRVGQLVQAAWRRRPRARLLCLLTILLAAGGGLAGWYLWADHQLYAAEGALERRDYDQARAHLALCLKAWPHSGQAHFLAARAARHANLYDEAEEHLRAARRFGYSPEAIALERGLIGAQGGDWSGEQALRSLADQDDPDADQVLELLTQRYIDTYRLPDALHCLNLFLQRRPDDVQALVGRGWVWERVLDYGHAAADYRRAVALDPRNDANRLRLAETLLITGPAVEAADHFRQLCARQPDNAAARVGLARAELQLGKLDGAGQLLDALLAQHPDNAPALSERGKLALKEGRAKAAEVWLRQAVALAPHDRQTVYAFYQALRQCGPKAEANQVRRQLERMDADLKHLDRATKAALKRPADPAPFCEAGVILLRGGESRKGLQWLNLSLQRDARYAPAHRALARYYQETAQPDRAAYHRRLAESPNPSFATTNSPASP